MTHTVNDVTMRLYSLFEQHDLVAIPSVLDEQRFYQDDRVQSMDCLKSLKEIVPLMRLIDWKESQSHCLAFLAIASTCFH